MMDTEIYRLVAGWSDSPEGFELIDSVELSEPCYSFDTLVVVKHDGEMRWYHDAGCSCPSPFEGVEWSDMDPDLEAMVEYIRDRVGDDTYFSSADLVDLQRKILEAS